MNYNNFIKKIAVCVLFVFTTNTFAANTKQPPNSAPPESSNPTKWSGNIPNIAKEPKSWQKLLEFFVEKKMHFHTLASSTRMLVFFNELQVKELAYRSIISIIDQGYPFPLQNLFLSGDLMPGSDIEFENSYNLYKSILNKDRGMEKWAKNYLENITKKNEFPKYQFYLAIELLSKKKYSEADEKLKSILKQEFEPKNFSFVKKATRTLARSYFDQEKYAEAFDIYNTYLLKLNPILPSDWLEAAWSLYYLKKYQEALGMVYNVDSKSATMNFMNLEKYTLRALIYRNLCAVQNAETLIESFQKDFGNVINALKRGESASKFPELIDLDIVENQEYKHISRTLNSLKEESKEFKKLSDELAPLAKYLYDSEIRMLEQRKKGLTDKAFELASNKLIMMDENLRFLKFDVQREKYNPDLVFKPIFESDLNQNVLETKEKEYFIHWNQYGDYWRDERLIMKGVLPNRCSDQ